MRATKLHVAESFARVTRRQYGKPRGVYHETILHDDPVSFICSPNSYACTDEYHVTRTRIFACAYTRCVLARASYPDTHCLLVRGLTPHRHAAGADRWQLFYGLPFIFSKKLRTADTRESITECDAKLCRCATTIKLKRYKCKCTISRRKQKMRAERREWSSEDSGAPGRLALFNERERKKERVARSRDAF